MTTSTQAIDFEAQQYDLAIRGALQPFPHMQSVPFMTETIVPICHPDLLEGGALKTPKALEKQTLISYDTEARIQTVHEDTNPRYHQLLSAFERETGCPVLVNTSFNVRGEPIVGSPEDAFRCFMGTELDVLAVGNCYLRKEQQDQSLKQNYETAFELD